MKELKDNIVYIVMETIRFNDGPSVTHTSGIYTSSDNAEKEIKERSTKDIIRYTFAIAMNLDRESTNVVIDETESEGLGIIRTIKFEDRYGHTCKIELTMNVDMINDI